MKRGEVWWVKFEGGLEGEIRKERPAVIISNNIANKYMNRLQVVPLTSNVARLYPSEACITVQGRRQKAMANQLTTVSKKRLGSRMGKVSRVDLRAVEEAVALQLGLLT